MTILAILFLKGKKVSIKKDQKPLNNGEEEKESLIIKTHKDTKSLQRNGFRNMMDSIKRIRRNSKFKNEKLKIKTGKFKAFNNFQKGNKIIDPIIEEVFEETESPKSP